jgi:valyl-tRNA synthetase
MAIRGVNAALDQYRFDQAASCLYQFIWHEYCDWYLEMIKPSLQNKDSADAKRTRQTMVDTFETVQRLMHPFMPFISEEIWQTLPHEGESIVTRPYPAPNPGWDSKDAETEFAIVERFVSTARTGRSLLNIMPGKSLTLFGAASDPEEWTTLVTRQPYAAHLSKGTITTDKKSDGWNTRVLRLPAEGLVVGILVEGDVDLRDALARISRQKQEYANECGRMEGKLANKEFLAKAPDEVVAEWRQRLATLKREIDLLAGSEKQLREMMT